MAKENYDKDYCECCSDVKNLIGQLKCKEQELKLAKRLIDKTSQFFNLTQYDWLADQNEITTEIEERVNRLKKQLFLAQNQISLKNEYIKKLKEQSKNKCAFRCLGNEFCPDAEEEIEELKDMVKEINNLVDKDTQIKD